MSAQPVEKFAVVANPGNKEAAKHEPFEAKLLETARKYYYLTQPTRARRHVIHSLQDLMAKGIHYVDYNPQDASFTEWDQKTLRDLMYTPTPRFQLHVETIASKYSSSDPRPEVLSPATDVKTRTVIRQVQDYADYLDWKFYRAEPKSRQTECKLIPLRGVFTEVAYDYTKGKEYEIPQLEGQEQGYCGDCGGDLNGNGQGFGAGVSAGIGQGDTRAAEMLDGGMQSRPACPACGSQNIQRVMGLDVKGNHKAREGEVCKYTYDPFQVEIFDRGRGIEDSPYLIVDEICFKTDLLKQYPWLESIEGQAMLGHWSIGYVGLHYLQQLEILVANSGRIDQSKDAVNPSIPGYTSGYGGAYLSDLMAWKRRVFLDASVYERWPAFEAPTQIPGYPSPIPVGMKPIDVWPKGLCIHILNSAKVVNTENVDKNKRWTMTDYRPASSGLHGSGLASLVSQQRLLDEVTSYQVYALFSAGHGITVRDTRIQEADGVPGHQYELAPDERMPGEAISNLIQHFDVGGGQAIAAGQPLKQDLVASMGDLAMASAPAASTLIPSTDRTATASKIQAGTVDALTTPPLELYAATRAKVIEQALELEREYGLQPKAYTKQGETAQRWFEPMKMPQDLRIVPAQDSWHPRDMRTRRENVGAALGAGLQIPAVLDEAMKVFGFADEADTYTDWAVKGEKRLDGLKAAVEGVQAEAMQAEAAASQITPADAVTNPDEVASLAAYDPVMSLIQQANAAPRPMDDNAAFVRFYEEVYLKDQFDEYPPLLQQAIEKLWMLHQQAEAMKQQAQTGLAMQAEAPLRDAAKADEAEASERENANQQAAEGAQGEREEMAAQREDMKAMNQQAEAQAQRRHDSSEAEKQRKHEKEMARINAKARGK